MKLLSPDGRLTRDLGIDEAACAFAQNEELLYCIGTPRQDGGYPLIAIDFEGKVDRVIGTVAPEHAPFSSLNPGMRLSPAPDGAGVSFAIVGSYMEELWLAEGLSEIALP